MFELNYNIILKMGWKEWKEYKKYSELLNFSEIPPLSQILFYDRDLPLLLKNPIYFKFLEDKKLCFIIQLIEDLKVPSSYITKRLSIKHKSLSIINNNSNDPKLKNYKKYNEYNFIIVDFSKKIPKSTTKILKSNLELLHLVRENLACDILYQRLFQINSILK